MKKPRLSALLALFGAIVAATSLFSVSQKVQNAENELHRLTEEVTTEKQSIRVLKAEWNYLNRPERLEALAGKYLDMEAPTVDEIRDTLEPLAPKIQENNIKAQPVSLASNRQKAAAPPEPHDRVGFQRLLDDLSASRKKNP